MRYKFVTIIPARGGSKRFPGKNTHNLNGTPLIGHSVAYSLNNHEIVGTYVSTDAEDIMQISREAGAEIIQRPAEFAGDHATTASAMKHAVQYLMDKGVEFDYVVLLQATNPLRPKNLLKEAINIIEKGGYSSLFTVTRSEKKLGKIIDGKFVPWNYAFGMRSQDMDPLFYENGLLYITSKEMLLQEIIEGKDAYPMIVDHPYGEVDIDTVEDFHYAEYILSQYNDE
jgi:N-acylneuraminate cytidylyltransferase